MLTNDQLDALERLANGIAMSDGEIAPAAELFAQASKANSLREQLAAVTAERDDLSESLARARKLDPFWLKDMERPCPDCAEKPHAEKPGEKGEWKRIDEAIAMEKRI